jgi:hypothetical protein
VPEKTALKRVGAHYVRENRRSAKNLFLRCNRQQGLHREWADRCESSVGKLH